MRRATLCGGDPQTRSGPAAGPADVCGEEFRSAVPAVQKVDAPRTLRSPAGPEFASWPSEAQMLALKSISTSGRRAEYIAPRARSQSV